MNQKKYIEPHPLKAKLLAWSEFNINEIDMLISVFKTQPVHEVYNFLEKLFDLNSSRPREKILIDLHYYAIKFAFDNDLNKIQISSFISIIRALHRANQETPFENYEYLVKYFQDLIICHSIKRPPYCVDIFDYQVVVKVVNYITNTYLINYKLYKYAFTPIVGVNLKVNYLNRTPSPEESYEYFNSNDIIENSASTIASSSGLRSKSNMSSTKQAKETPIHVEMRNYIRNILVEHLNKEETQKILQNLQSEMAETAVANKVNSAKTKKK